jgi:bilirubin oxidase
MMAAFNVSSLNDFNYTETTHFIDPMEPQYRAKPIKSGEFAGTGTWGTGEFSLTGVKDKGDWFSNLDAYDNVDEVEIALEEYWSRTTLIHTATTTAAATSRTLVSSSLSGVVTTSTTSSAPAATSPSKGNKGKGGKLPRRNLLV